MEKIVKKKIVREVVQDIICDCCGKSCLDSEKVNYELANLSAHWGFYSERDLEKWECDLCEKCAVKVKEFIDRKELGKPHHIYCERLVAFPDWAESGWNKEEDLGGGGALDVQIHDIDYIISILGKPDFINSQGTYNSVYGGWAHMVTNMGFSDGISGCVQAGWGLPPGFPFTNVLRVVCENGTIEWILRAGKLLEKRDLNSPMVIYKPDGTISKETPDSTDAFLNQWKYFIDCLESESKIKNATFEDVHIPVKSATPS